MARTGVFSKLRQKALELLRERAEPREVGQAIALGVWVGTSPAFGLHGWLAVGLATLLRRNRAFAFVGSRVSFFLLLPWILLSEVEIGRFLRTREWAPIDHRRIVEEAPHYLLDLCIGWAVLGPIYALCLGALAVPAWRAWRARQAQRSLNANTEPLPPPPSSAPSP